MLKNIDRKYPERVNYTIEDGVYVGTMVNLPISIVGETLEDLKENTRFTVEVYINDLQKTLELDSFEYIEDKIQVKS